MYRHLVLNMIDTLAFSLLLYTPSMYMHNASHLCLHIFHHQLDICEVHSCWQRQTLLFDRLLYWLYIALACCHHYKTEPTLHTK